jgi:hypothetical protein
MNMKQWWNDIDGKPKNLEKNLSQCHFLHHIFNMGTNLGLSGEKLVTYCLVNGSAYMNPYKTCLS